MRCRIFIFLAMIWSSAALANFLPSGVKPPLCDQQVQSHLQTIFSPGTSPHWSRVVDPDFETTAYRVSTHIGEWYELHVSEGKAPQLLTFSPESTHQISWNEKDCHKDDLAQKPLQIFSQEKDPEALAFTDADLKKLLSSGKKGMIYMWSPHMVYSVEQSENYAAVARKKKMEFTAVLDPMVPVAEAAAAMKTQKKAVVGSRRIASVSDLRKLNSIDLYMREATLHFPTVFVYKNGKIHPHRIIGVLTPQGLSNAVDQWLEEIP